MAISRPRGRGVTSVQVADDITLAAPDTTPKLEKNSAFFMALQLGLVDHLDVYGSTALGGPFYGGLKLQLLGDSFQEAKAGNLSLSVAAGLALSENSKTISKDDVDSKATNHFSGYEAMAILGFRPSDWTLLYVNPFVSHVVAKTYIDQTPKTGSATVTSRPDGEGDMRGAAVGLRFGKYFFVNGELSFTQMTWKRTNPTVLEAKKLTDTALGISLGGAW